MPPVTIKQAETPNDLVEAARLFEAYADSLGIDLSFQGFATEMAAMPGKYANPQGALFLAVLSQGTTIGCVGLRQLTDEGICEMKRLYVEPSGRGTGAGRALADAVIAEARSLGYHKMRLDTLSSMTSALALYTSLGFKKIDAYYATPLASTVFLELVL